MPSPNSKAIQMKKKQIESVLIALRRMMRATELHSRELVKKTGLTTPQLLLMQSIRQQGDVSIGELAMDVNLSQATVTSILDRLEARGFVIRQRSQVDKRKVHANLTELGKETIKRSPTPLQESFVREFKGLEDWEQHMIIASLQKVAAMMDAQDIDAAPMLDVGNLDRMADQQDKPR